MHDSLKELILASSTPFPEVWTVALQDFCERWGVKLSEPKDISLCQNCKSTRIAFAPNNPHDTLSVFSGDTLIYSSETVKFWYCLDCGQIQGLIPLKEPKDGLQTT